VQFDYAVPENVYPESVRVVRRAGFRVRPVEVEAWPGDVGIGFRAFRHLGVLNPTGEQQIDAREQLLAALRSIGLPDPVSLGSGIVIGGGTPSYRWLEVTLAGIPTGLKVLAASEEDIGAELDRLVTTRWPEIAREQLDVIRPDVWPIPTMFPRW
jgi:hypothetical protein